MTIIGIILGLLILSLLVTIHESGHYIAAKRAGVVVEEFAIGMGPLAWSKKLNNGTLFSIRWLPIGGFCKMKGENDADRKKGSYGSTTFWQKTKILFAGVMLNWTAAAVVFTILALVGLPKVIDNPISVASDTNTILSPVTVSYISPDTPAEKAGLAVGDEIISIAGEQITVASKLSEVTSDKKGESVQIIYRRGGTEETASAELRSDNSDKKGYLGVAPFQSSYIKATWSAPVVGVGATLQLTVETFKGVGKMAGDFFGGLAKQVSLDAETRKSGQESIGEASNNVAGPVGIIGVIFPSAAQSGAITLLFLAGVISLSLAVMNILPIPALDGGRWLLTAIFKVTKRPLTKEIEERVVTAGFLLLMGLVILITIVDVTRII